MKELALVCVACGMILLWRWYCAGLPTIVARVSPYLRDSASPNDAFPSLTQHGINLLGRLVSLCGSTPASVMERQRHAGQVVSVRSFRLAQLVWGAMGTAVGTLWAITGAVSGQLAPAAGLMGVATASFLAVMARDRLLTTQARRRQEHLARALPDVVELLALAVGAGESIGDALARVSQVACGPAGEELRTLVRHTSTGTPLARALSERAAANDCAALTRLADTIAHAVARGTPLAAILREQARDERETARSALMESAGKKEIAMLGPVVFLILPLTVLFALYPGLLALKFGV